VRGQCRVSCGLHSISPPRRLRQAGREDSPALRMVPAGRSLGAGRGGASGTRPARGEGPGYGLRLRARGPGGAAALRARPGIRSTLNCTLGGRRAGRFEPLSPSDRPSWSLRAPLGVGGRPPASPQRPTEPWRDHSAAFHLDWPPSARHTPSTSKKQIPTSPPARPPPTTTSPAAPFVNSRELTLWPLHEGLFPLRSPRLCSEFLSLAFTVPLQPQRHGERGEGRRRAIGVPP